ncbi:MAG: Holliday junction branch migration DNA helicase RuvB, partial [Pseudanabaena sp.]
MAIISSKSSSNPDGNQVDDQTAQNSVPAKKSTRRSSKKATPSPEIQQALDLLQAEATPEEKLADQ